MEDKIKKQVKNLSNGPGVYKFYDVSNNLLYVGKAKNLKKRISSYFTNKNLGPKTTQMISKITKVDCIKVFSEFEALLLEADLIRNNKPFYNIQSKDGKSPIYITISKDKVPIIEIVRGTNLKRSKNLFIKGPFPSRETTQEILRTIRRIFPYCQHKNVKKPCLYVHLGLCPYPYKNENARRQYLKLIAKTKLLLSGKSKKLIFKIKREMKSFAKTENYEQAQIAKDQIKKLEYITSAYHTPREFLERPTLVDDLTQLRLADLKEKLRLQKIPKRIECYDISNISGKFATGSMVVFVNGKPQKSEYRKFKVKFKAKPDDFEMLREVLARRFKNDWPDADLIIIDGGRGQLSSAYKVAKKYKKNLPMISIAKKLEDIYLPAENKPLSWPKDSPARQLTQALRDEAHRFAITYHRLLRSKDFISGN